MKISIKIEHDTGDVMTYTNGLLHSSYDYEPSVITKDGYLIFFRHGKLHRESGPAYYGPNNTVEYWLDGIMYSKEDWNMITNHDDHYP